MRRALPVVLITVLSLAIVAAAIGVLHFATRSNSGGKSVMPNLPTSGSYVVGSVPSSDVRTAMKAAASELPAMLSYDYRDLPGSLKRAQANATPGYSAAFSKTFTTTVQRTATADEDVATSSVRAVSYVSTGKRGAVTCLVFVDQTVTRTTPPKGVPAHQVDEDRVVVVMSRVGKRWLVADLTPV